MILSSLLLLSPALSSLAAPLAAPQVIIRRQGVERPAPHAGHVHQHQTEDLEEALEELELETLATELGDLGIEYSQLHGAHQAQEPGGQAHATIRIRFDDGREQVMEWEGDPQQLGAEINRSMTMLFPSASGGFPQQGVLELSPEIIAVAKITDDDCGDCDGGDCDDCDGGDCDGGDCDGGDCDEAFGAWDEGDCEECDIIEEVEPEVFAWAMAPEGNAFFFDSDEGPDFGCDCEGCPLSSQQLHGGHAMMGHAMVPPQEERHVIRFGSDMPAPNGQWSEHGQRPEHGQWSERGEGPRGQFRMRAEAMPRGEFRLAPPRPQGDRGGLEAHVEELDRRLDRIEAMLEELTRRR